MINLLWMIFCFLAGIEATLFGVFFYQYFNRPKPPEPRDFYLEGYKAGKLAQERHWWIKWLEGCAVFDEDEAEFRDGYMLGWKTDFLKDNKEE